MTPKKIYKIRKKGKKSNKFWREDKSSIGKSFLDILEQIEEEKEEGKEKDQDDNDNYDGKGFSNKRMYK